MNESKQKRSFDTALLRSAYSGGVFGLNKGYFNKPEPALRTTHYALRFTFHISGV